MYPYGLVGNCQVAALIHNQGRVDWLCFSRPDGPPIFGRILDEEGGSFAIESVRPAETTQAYLPNTAVLQTTFRTRDNGVFQVTDFFPRYYHHERIERPFTFFRILRPLEGTPDIRVLCRPVDGWSKKKALSSIVKNNLRYEIGGDDLWLSTNMSLTYLMEGIPFILNGPVYFGLTWNFHLPEDLPRVCEDDLSRTIHYWRTWVKHCSIPVLYQKETIRSAITLKLHCYEDTGAILAALTTSLPEAANTCRNWDYRFCWPRDTYYTLSAFHNLGHFEEMEGFLKFLLNVARHHEFSPKGIAPVYRLDQTLPLPEREHPEWRGFQNCVPVRSNNAAASQIQNDVYGEMILTFAPIYFDERFEHLRTREHEDLLIHLVKLACESVGRPDAGLWELRQGPQEHSFTNLMCWAGIERIRRISEGGHFSRLSLDLKGYQEKAEKALQRAVFEGSLRNGPEDNSFNAALLQISLLHYPDKELCQKTVFSTAEDLKILPEEEGFLFRYRREDDFGRPESAFIICSFWLIQALANLGEQKKALAIMEKTMRAANPLGLISEHYDPLLKKQWGNFPQAYSHVGQINAAFAIGPSWNQLI